MLRTQLSLSLEKSELQVEEQIKLKGHKWHISSLDFSVNGLFLASGSWDKELRVWDLSTLETSRVLGQGAEGHSAPITTVSWLPSVESCLVTGSADNTACIWNVETGHKFFKIRLNIILKFLSLK